MTFPLPHAAREERLRDVDRMVLAQMKPGHAYRSYEIVMLKNDRGIREAGGVLKRLSNLGFVDRIETGENNLLWALRSDLP